MKKLLSGLMIIFLYLIYNSLSGLLSAQPAQYYLTDPVIVAGGAQYGSIKPRIALLHDTLPIVCWTSHSPGGKIFCSRWNGTGFSNPVQVTPDGLDAYANPSDGPSIAVSGDTVFISFFTMTGNTSKIYILRSVDGGMTFGDTIRVDHQNGTGYEPYSPFVAIAPGGNPYIAFEMSTGTGANPQQMFCKSDDGGLTFSNEIAANTLGPGIPCECCPPFLLLQDSRVYLLYRNNISNIRDTWCAVSDNFGASFDTVFRVDFTNWQINGCPSQGPEAIFSGDSIITVWTGKQTGSYARIYTGEFHALTLETNDNVKIDSFITGPVIQWNPVLSGSNDTLGVAWQDTRLGYETCFMTYSTSGINGFTLPLMISDSAITGTQLTPHLTFRDGVFHIVYRNENDDQVIYRKLILGGGVGISPANENKSGISIYPNPVVSESEIIFDGLDGDEFELSVFDQVQRLLYTSGKFSNNRFCFSRDHFAPGIYLGVLSGKNSSMILKISIQ